MVCCRALDQFIYMSNIHHTSNQYSSESVPKTTGNIFYRTPEARWHSTRVARKKPLHSQALNPKLDEALRDVYRHYDTNNATNGKKIEHREVEAYVNYIQQTGKLLKSYRLKELGEVDR